MNAGDGNISEEKRSDAEHSNFSDEDSEESGSSEEEMEVELMVNARSRRANAGNKMSALIESTNQEDDFYKSAYGGGFNEDDADDVFESPVQSDIDEVDSDFDKPEEDDEPISGGENEEERGKRKTKGYKEPKRGSRADLLAKNKAWAVARMAGKVVAANTVDAKTQAARLREAEKTEKANLESLRKYEQFELERKKKREHATTRRKVPPPYISVKHTISETMLVVPDIKVFKKPEVKSSFICAVTGRSARYRDPLTGLPYSKEDCLSGSRASTFRHIFGHSFARGEWFDWGAGHASCLVANPKFIAVALEGGSGGQILVGTLEDFGKHRRVGLAQLQDHTSVVTDIKWDSFNDNVLASGSVDCSVKIWHVTDQLKSQCVRTFVRHTRRVDQVEWHTTVDNVLLSAGSDCKIFLWDVEANSVIYEISDFSSSCIAFSPNSSLFAATSRQSHRVCIFDARTGNAMKSAILPHDGGMPPKVVFASAHRLVTFGNTRINRRQFAIHDISSFGTPLATIDVDGSSGQLCPLFDPDLNLLYISGKGDSTFRLYEFINRSPYVVYLTECQQQAPHTCVCAISKRALNLTGAEVMRVYRLHPQSLLIQPLSFIVPRRSDQFHPDLYPPTRGPTPAASLAEWQEGLDVVPVQLQLRPGQLTTTSKPVLLKGRLGSPKLITSDLNNEKKFRFLSKITRPDYRSVEEREDCEEITKLIEVTQKIHEGRRSNSSKSNEEEAEEASDVVAELSPISSENIHDQQQSSQNAPTAYQPPSLLLIDVVPPIREGTDIHRLGSRSSDRGSSATPPSKAERTRIISSPRHLSLDRLSKHREISPNPSLRIPGDSRISPRLSPLPLHFVDTPTRGPAADGRISADSNPFKRYFRPEEKNGVSMKISVSSHRSDDSILSLATCGTAPVVGTESVDDLDAEVSIMNGNVREDGSGSDTARSFDEGHRLLENTVTMLERQLRRYDARIQQLESLCELQQKDMESLRYEISWKDERIEYLQKTLAEMEGSLQSSSANPYPS